MPASLLLRLNSLTVVRHSDTGGGYVSLSNRQLWGSFSHVAANHSPMALGFFLHKPGGVTKFFFLQEQITKQFKFKTTCRGRALFFTLEMRYFLKAVYQSPFSFPSQLLHRPVEMQQKLENVASQRGETLPNTFPEASWPQDSDILLSGSELNGWQQAQGSIWWFSWWGCISVYLCVYAWTYINKVCTSSPDGVLISTVTC